MAGLDSIIHREDRTFRGSLWSSPLSTFLHYFSSLYFSPAQDSQSVVKAGNHNSPTKPIKIVCISDTHNTLHSLPTGDILIHAGDITQSGTLEELQASLAWLKTLPHPHKIIIAGNHDSCLDTEPAGKIDWDDIIYLNNTSITLTLPFGTNLKVFGSPLTPCQGSFPFQYPRHENIWNSEQVKIPNDTDILITHGPPAFHLDCGGIGCRFLLRKLWGVRPRLHVFGHVHYGRGAQRLVYDEAQGVYERICLAKKDRRGSWCNWWFIRDIWRLAWVVPSVILWGKGESAETMENTVLVNAAMVSGFRDEKRNEAIVVDFYND